MSYDSGIDIALLPSAVVAEIPKQKSGILSITAHHDHLPDAFLKNLDQIKVVLLSIFKADYGTLEADTLKKLFHGPPSSSTIALADTAINKESAKIIAASTRPNMVWLIPSYHTIYPEEILKILNENNIPSGIEITARKEAFEEYRKKYPWFELKDQKLISPNKKLKIEY